MFHKVKEERLSSKENCRKALWKALKDQKSKMKMLLHFNLLRCHKQLCIKDMFEDQNLYTFSKAPSRPAFNQSVRDTNIEGQMCLNDKGLNIKITSEQSFQKIS